MNPVFDKQGIKIFHMDCMQAMEKMQDKQFELAIVDPPFGIGENWKKDPKSKFYKHSSTYKNNEIPSEKYFDQLFRVSENQIIWGCNYYWRYLEPTNHLIFWDKKRLIEQFNSQGELAWTNITKYPFIKVELLWNGCITCEPRCGNHPHEKPVALYRWLLEKYARQGDKILDTHLGSGSIAIACLDLGFVLTAYEIDGDYLKDTIVRIEKYLQQPKLFKPIMKEAEQTTLF